MKIQAHKEIVLLIIFLVMNNGLIAQTDQPLIYKYEENTSIQANAVKLFLGIRKLILKNKNGIISKSGKESKAANIPKSYFKKYNIDTLQIEGRSVFTLSCKKKVSNKHILYIHGGAYVNNILKPHWHLIDKLLEKTNAVLLVPDYPLAPQHTVIEGMAFMDAVYEYLLAKVNSKDIIIMGDSAGGGFSLGFSQRLKKREKPQPSQIILLAPWLDISTSNPEMRLIEKKDPMLTVHDLKIAGKYWTGNLDTKNYLVSPIYGEFNNLGKISVFIGGQDILAADAKKLKHKMKAQNISFNYYEYPKMFHVWMGATFLKESKLAISQISKLINSH